MNSQKIQELKNLCSDMVNVLSANSATATVIGLVAKNVFFTDHKGQFKTIPDLTKEQENYLQEAYKCIDKIRAIISEEEQTNKSN